MNPSTINFHNIKSLLLRKKYYTKPKKLVSSDKTGKLDTYPIIQDKGSARFKYVGYIKWFKLKWQLFKDKWKTYF